MDFQTEWTTAQKELSDASRNDLWWRSLSDIRRGIIGRAEHRSRCRDARARLKAADARCKVLLRMRRGLSVSLAA